MRRRYRRVTPALLLMLVVAIIGGSTFLVSHIAEQQSMPTAYLWAAQTPLISPYPTPLQPYLPYDAALMDALANDGFLGTRPLDARAAVVEIGAYLPVPQVANPPAPLMWPVVQPVATSPAFSQTEDLGLIPTPSVEPPGYLVMPPIVNLTPQPYAGDDCAPRGLPTGGVFTQRFHAWHSGVDYGIPVGTYVKVTHSGQVIFAGWSLVGYGNLIIIQNGMFITYYAHLNGFNVVEGQLVGAGTVIGYSGNTGNSSGPHIHYEVRINDMPVDPLTFDRYGYPTC